MNIYIDGTYNPPVGTTFPDSSEMTSTFRTHLLSALSSLNSKFSALLGGATGNVIFTTYFEGNPVGTTGVYFPWMVQQAGWFTELETHFAATSTPYNKATDTVILIAPNELNALEGSYYNVVDVDGAHTVVFDHERLMFHELAHVLSVREQAKYNAFRYGNTGADPWEADTIAIAAENIIYQQSTPGAGIAGPHDGLTQPGIGAVNAFVYLSGNPDFSMTSVDGTLAAVFSETDAGQTVRKIIFARGFDPAGEDGTSLNHYILNEIETEDPLIDEEGNLRFLFQTSVDNDSASSNFSEKVTKTRSTLDGLQEFADTRPLKFIPSNVDNVLNNLPLLDQTRARLISVETSSKAGPVEVVGPQKAGSSGANAGAAKYLSISAGETAAILVGGAGFDHRNADFSNRLDDLYGSGEGDLIVGGDGLASGDDRSILDGRGGNDVIVTGSGISHAKGGDGDDIILAGSGDTKVDGGKDTDIFAFYDHTAAWQIDLSDEDDDGYGLAKQGGEEVRIKGVEVFYGGDLQTTFIGSGKGKGSTFIAGAGGGDFTLRAGDRAYGRAGVQDVFQFFTKKDPGVKSDETAQDYLKRNKVYVDKIGAEDQVFINGVEFLGNKVTTAFVGERVASDKNEDHPYNAYVFTGTSTWETAYAGPTFETRGAAWDGDPWGALVYADMQYRDVSYSVANESGFGMISFFARGVTAREWGGSSINSGSTGYTFNPLNADDEQLNIVIGEFSSGDGGMTFENDGLANTRAGKPDDEGDSENSSRSQNFGSPWADEPRVGVGTEYDVFDGNVDGFTTPGGTSVGVDDPRFNFGETYFGWEEIDWDAYTSGPSTVEGSDDPDYLQGGWANDEIIAGDGDDVLIGGPGDDLLNGGAGNDQIYGGDGNDTLLGGIGDDHLSGDAGRNTIDGGDGDDVAYLPGSMSDFRIYRTLDGTIIAEHLYDAGNVQTLTNVETLSFYDGTLEPGDLPMGTSGNDILTGSARADLLDGGTGDDEMAGGEGDDIYVVDALGDIVAENEYEGSDTVRTSLASYTLGDHLEKLVFTGSGSFAGTGNELDNEIAGGAGNDALAGGFGYDRFVGGGGSDTIDGGDDWDTVVLAGKPEDYSYSIDVLGIVTVTNGTNSVELTDVENLEFDGGRNFEVSELLAKYVVGTAGNDTLLEGDSTDNVIRGLAGDDNLRGGGGSDLLNGGDGQDTAHYAGSSADYIIYRSPAAGLTVSDQVGSDGTDLLSNVEALHFDGDNVTIDVSTVAPLGTSGNDTIVGSSRRDRLYGLAGNDNLSGANGADWLEGGAGNDTLDGAADNDSLYGGAGNDITIFGAGNDIAWDVSGDDSYVYEAGDGADRIRDDGGTDAIILGSTITPGDVTLSVDDDDIILTFSGGGSLTIQNGMVAGSEIEEIRFDDSTVWNPILRLQTPTSENDNLIGTISADTISGGAGNDIIEGRQGNDTLAGDIGNDVLSGGAGDDTYLFALGDGTDMIQDASSNYNYGSGGNDTLIFGVGIAPIDIQVSMANGSDIVLTINGTSDQVTLKNSALRASDSIETVQFADTTVWTHADLMSKLLVSTSGNDDLYGSYAADTISGGAGNDYINAREGDDIITGGTGNDNITGGTGNDTYHFNLGDGQDYISDFTSAVSTSLDKVVFGAGILPTDIIVSQADNGGDLVLSIAGTSDKITINDAAFANGYRIEEIRFADSTVWTHGDLMTRAYGPRSTGDTYWGTSAADTIFGGAGNDLIIASGGNDTLAGGTGNDTFYGDGGTDTVVLMGLRPTYSMLTSGGFLKVTDNAPTVDNNDGTDDLRGIEKLRFSDNEEIGIVSPIILDLNGGGVTTVSAYVGRARYDMDGDGVADITSWMGRGEGMLFLDRDGNGTLSNAGEFSFVSDVEGAASDLVGLRAFDSNGDGTLSSADSRFTDFRIWRDGNGDGSVQDGEVFTLGEAGVASLNLSGQTVEGRTALGEVAVLNTGSYTRTDGREMQFIDAALTYFSGTSQNTDTSATKQQFRPQLRRQLGAFDRDGLRGGGRRELQVDWQYARDPIAHWPQRGDQRLWSGPEIMAIDNRDQFAIAATSTPSSASSIDRQLAMMVQEMSVFGARSGEGLGAWQRENIRPLEFFA